MRWVVLLALAVAACDDRAVSPSVPEPPNFIINGTPTGAEFGSVGALMFDRNADGVINGHDLWCTGSLIAPTIFLTAAHCVVTPFTPPGSEFHVSFAPDLFARNARFIRATGYTFDPPSGTTGETCTIWRWSFCPRTPLRG